MNIKNIAMWAIIVFLTIGLYNMFKNPQSNVRGGNQVIFSEFLTSVDNGEVLKVEIQGNNIKGVYSNGNSFTTYSPNDPNLIEKLSDKGVSISAAPIRRKNAIFIWCFTFMVSNVVINCCLDFLYETNARWQRWSNGFWKIKSKNDE
jgi:ATP-dependent Zn protease